MKVSVQVNLPKAGLVDIGRLRAALDSGLDDSAQKVQANLEKPTSTWQAKVAFQIKAIANGRTISTDNEIYGYVSKGTRPHIIRAKNARYLNFGPSSPKTIPGSLDSGSGSRGPRDTFRQQVRHPGTKARNFDKTAAKIAAQEFPRRMQEAVKEGVKG